MKFVLEKDHSNIGKDWSVTWAARGSGNYPENIFSNKKVRTEKRREKIIVKIQHVSMLLRRQNHHKK